jgi:CHAD domain-containing protein
VNSTLTQQRERELKFDVPDGWELPNLASLLPTGGSVARRSVSLDSTYYDTADHALRAARVTLRRRTGDEDEGWQLKVPTGDARTEIGLPLGPRGVPAELRQLTTGVRAGEPLRPVARVRTERQVHAFLAPDGTLLAELAFDDVIATAMGESATVTAWREVEVELKGGDEALLKRAAKALRRSGAEPSASGSKLARALGATMSRAPSGAPKSVLDAVLSFLAEQHAAIVAADLELRRDRDVVHVTRVATRRYRSALRVFDDLFDADRAAFLDGELKWYAGVLGAVRDLQVLGKQLRAELGDLPDELVLGPVSARLEQTLSHDLAAARSKLASALGGRRYVALLRELRAWAEQAPVVAKDKPAARLDKYLSKAERTLDRRIELAAAVDDDAAGKNETLHRVRKAAKRARYTAELSAPALGKRAAASAKRAKKLQTTLGHRQDAVIAVEFLRRLGAVAGTTPGENGFTFGLLFARVARRGQDG